MCLTLWGENKNDGQFTIIFKPIFSIEKQIYLIQISLKFVPKVPINNMPALVQIMAWCQPRDVTMGVARETALASSTIIVFQVENTNIQGAKLKVSCYNHD